MQHADKSLLVFSLLFYELVSHVGLLCFVSLMNEFLFHLAGKYSSVVSRLSLTILKANLPSAETRLLVASR